MTDRMKLSVVIPCFNERATIEAIVDAVRASSWSPKEIIVKIARLGCRVYEVESAPNPRSATATLQRSRARISP